MSQAVREEKKIATKYYFFRTDSDELIRKVNSGRIAPMTSPTKLLIVKLESRMFCAVSSLFRVPSNQLVHYIWTIIERFSIGIIHLGRLRRVLLMSWPLNSI